jgi:hypothetical protein
VAEASSRSFAHLLRHGLRRRPTSGKPSSQPDEPTTPLTCIRKRSTDGLRCEGTWACAWGRWQDRSGIRGIECDHKFLRWQQLSQSKLPLTGMLIRVCNRPLQERHRTDLSREQMSLWLAGYPKTPRFDVWFGSNSAVVLDRPGRQLTRRAGRMPTTEGVGHSGCEQMQQVAPLIYHLVGSHE